MTATAFTKAAKGHLVAFQRTSSYTSLASGTHRRTYWAVGVVAGATRDGTIKTIRHGNLTMPHKVGTPAMLATSIAKPVAAVVADALRLEEFETIDATRDAIKALLTDDDLYP